MGPGDWIVEPVYGGQAVRARTRHPDRRQLLISSDGSALRTDGYLYVNDADDAFAAGERTPVDAFGKFVDASSE